MAQTLAAGAGWQDGRMGVLARFFAPQKTDASHRVTTVELFFDLVFVFALTQVTAWIAHEHSVLGTAQGLLVLTIMWWTWIMYAWLGNVMRADTGAALAGFIVSMPAVFVVALTIRHVWEAPGGALAPLAFAAAYIGIRVVHTAVYGWGGRTDRALFRQIMATGAAFIPTGTLVVLGAYASPGDRLWWWAAALFVDLSLQWILSEKLGGWIIASKHHIAERWGLIVILALGESVVAVGVAAEAIDLSLALIITAVLGVLTAVGFWWVYFRNIAPQVEQDLQAAGPAREIEIGLKSYTFGHLPLVAGIIIAAAGVEEAVFAIADKEVAGVAAILIASGAALLCLAGAALIASSKGPWRWFAVATAFFVSGIFWMPSLDPLVALGVTAVVFATVGILTPAARLAQHSSEV